MAGMKLANDSNHVWYEKAFNWTKFISGSFATTFDVCSKDVYLAYTTIYTNTKAFPTSINWVESFL